MNSTKLCRWVILALIISPVLILSGAILSADPENILPDGFPKPYEAEGQVFEISPTLRLESTQPIRLTADIITQTHLSFIISPAESTHGNKTTLTLSGIEGLGHRHQDGFFVESHQPGQITWEQDVKTDHHVYFLPEVSTINIWGRDDYRDEVVSKGVGIWLDATTCQLTTDVEEAIVIQADGITLDGNWHSIAKLFPYLSGYGIYLFNRTDVSIINCTVTRYATGIFFYGGSNNIIVGNYTYSNGAGISLYLSTHTNIIDNTASLNYLLGIYLSGSPFPPGSESSYVTITGNDTSSNNGVGIALVYTHHITVTANTADANDFAGIHLGNCSDNVVSNNRTRFNRGWGSFDPDRGWGGINLQTSYNNIVTGNMIESNDYGMSFLDSDNNSIYENDIHDNDYGFNLVRSTNNKIYQNNVWNNTVYNASSVYFVWPLPFPFLAMELSYQNQGNWWGKDTEPFFIAGEDTNDIEVTDTYAYAVPDAWKFGLEPGEVPDNYVQPHEIITTISVGPRPMEIAMAPSGQLAYVLNYDDNTISVIDLVSQTTISTIDIGQTSLFDIAFAPQSDQAYVTHQNGTTIINVTTESFQTLSYPGKTFKGIAVSPSGQHLYALESTENKVYVFETATRNLLVSIPLDFTPHKIAVSPNGLLAYVSHPNDNLVSVLDLASYEVSETLSIVSPYEIVFDQSGDKAYVCSKDLYELVEIDTATHDILRYLAVSGEVMWIALTPDDQFAYVSTKDPSYSVCVVDLDTGIIVADIPVGLPMECPAGLAITPDGYDCYVTSENEDAVYVISVKAHPYLRRVKIIEIIADLPLPGGPITIKGFGFSTVAEENIVHLGIYILEATVNDDGTELATTIPPQCCGGTYDLWVETPWGTSNRLSLFVMPISDVLAEDGLLYNAILALYDEATSQATRNILDQIMRHLFGIGQEEDDQNDMISKLQNGQNVAAMERIAKAIRLLERFEKKEGVDTSAERQMLAGLGRYILQKLIDASVPTQPNDPAKIDQAEQALADGRFKVGAAMLTKFHPRVTLGTPVNNFQLPEPFPEYICLNQSITATFRVENSKPKTTGDVKTLYLSGIAISHTKHTTIEYKIADKTGVIDTETGIDNYEKIEFDEIEIEAGDAFVGELTITGMNASTVVDDALIKLKAYFGLYAKTKPCTSTAFTVVDVKITQVVGKEDGEAEATIEVKPTLDIDSATLKLNDTETSSKKDFEAGEFTLTFHQVNMDWGDNTIQAEVTIGETTCVNAIKGSRINKTGLSGSDYQIFATRTLSIPHFYYDGWFKVMEVYFLHTYTVPYSGYTVMGHHATLFIYSEQFPPGYQLTFAIHSYKKAGEQLTSTLYQYISGHGYDEGDPQVSKAVEETWLEPNELIGYSKIKNLMADWWWGIVFEGQGIAEIELETEGGEE